MPIDALAYVLEFFLGPLFLLFHLPELPTAIGDISQILSGLSGGEVGVVVENFLAGQYDVAGKTLTSMAGTLLWLAIVVGVFGELGGLGEMGELVEIFG